MLNKNTFLITVHILISLDGNKENNQYRLYKNGKESFGSVVRNVQSLYLNHPLFFKNNVEFSTVLHGRSNYIDAVEFFSRWAKIPLFSQITEENVRRNLGKEQKVFCMHDYSAEEMEYFRKRHPHEYSVLFPAIKGQCSLWLRKQQVSVQLFNELIYDSYDIYLGGSCSLFTSKAFVTEDGKIYLCEKSSRKFIFGNIHKGKLTIYLKHINAYYAKMRYYFRVACLKCYKGNSCDRCFFAECDNICGGKCFCSKEQAIAEFVKMFTE